MSRGKKLAPFIWTAGVWALAWSVVFALDRNLNSPQLLRWFLSGWLLCMVNLFSLAKTMSAAVELAACTEAQVASGERMIWILKAFFWGGLKLACLGVFIVFLLAGRKAPMEAVLTGLATIVVVPLFGGIFWGLLQSRDLKTLEGLGQH